MGVDSFQQRGKPPKGGKGKGKGKDKGGKGASGASGGGASGKSQGECRNCGKWGRRAADCWSPEREAGAGPGG
eukprot:11184304-Lingulodinium_polyedra.AAC.1